MTENDTQLQTQITEDQLILSWKTDKNYHSSITFEWRNILIHLNIEYNPTIFEIKTLINGEKHRFGWGRSHGGGGSIGEKPNIETPTHQLLVSLSQNQVKLLDKNKTDNSSANNDGIPFKIIFIPSSFDFKEPVPVPDANKIFKSKLNSKEVTLYEFKDGNITINSLAYFEKDILVVDYWKLGYRYEDEYFTYVYPENLSLLFHKFEIEKENNSALLIAILNMFKGEHSFTIFREFLSENNIPFSGSTRHD